MSTYSKFKKATGAHVPEPVNNYFTEHNNRGYQSKQGLVDYTKSLTETEYKHVEDMYDLVRQRAIITNRLEAKEDVKTGEFVIWSHFEMANGKRRLPIPFDEGILRFLIEYQQFGLRFEADFTTLLSEAGINFNEYEI